jgi:hypothetical protein
LLSAILELAEASCLHIPPGSPKTVCASVHRVFRHAGDYVTVGVERDRDGRVTQDVGHDLHVDACPERERGEGVPMSYILTERTCNQPREQLGGDLAWLDRLRT